MSLIIKEKPIEEKIKDLPYDLPEGWRWERLENLLLDKPQYGLSVKASKNEAGIPILRMGNIYHGKLDLSDLKYVKVSDDLFEKYGLKDGDLLFNRTNSLELVGKTALFQEKDKYLFASYLIRLRPKHDIVSGSYLNYFINLNETQNALKKFAGQATNQANINATKLQTLQIPLPFRNEYPDLETQSKIVAKITEVFEKIEQAEKLRQTALQKTKSTFDAVLNKIFKDAEKGKDWKRVKLGVIGDFMSGGTPPKGDDNYWGGTIPFVTGADITSLYITEHNARTFLTEAGLTSGKTAICPKGTILIVSRTRVGRIGIADCIMGASQDITPYICNDTIVPEYVCRYLEGISDILIDNCRGATIKGLTRDFITNLDLPLPYKNSKPDMHKQREIVEHIGSIQDKTKQLDELQTIQLTKFIALKDSILNKAFRGELSWA